MSIREMVEEQNNKTKDAEGQVEHGVTFNKQPENLRFLTLTTAGEIQLFLFSLKVSV